MTAPSSRHVRWLWALLAYACVGLALAGLVLPVLPTTPFALLAAYAAARGSEKIHRWLLSHRSLGPMLDAWQDGRAVARRPKLVATGTMAVSAAVLFLVAPSVWLAAGVTAFMASVATWLWLRPEPAAGGVRDRPRSSASGAGSRPTGSP